MKTYLECMSCFVQQAVEAGKFATEDTAVRETILRTALKKASAFPFHRTPPHFARELHQFVRDLSGNADPYEEIKEQCNREMMALYPLLKKKVRASMDPFGAAARLAIEGNIIDFGVAFNGQGGRSMEEVMDAATTAKLAIDDLDELREAVADAKRILYIGDNAGEIVNDRIFIEELPIERITYVVRGTPIINDVTVNDAHCIGLADIMEVIESGSDAPGTIMEFCSEEFRRRFALADLVISKGQGNYETLDDTKAKCKFFMLKAKCFVVARQLGCPLGSMVVKRG